MFQAYTKKRVLEKNELFFQEREKPSSDQGLLPKNVKRVHPIGLHRSISSLSLSSVSLSLSENSDDSSRTDSPTPLDQKISLALRLIASPSRREVPPRVAKNVQQQQSQESNDEELRRRCNWITENSDKVYVAFHDECWGVPVYDDNQLFELLAMAGMLMDYNWTEILKRKELFREAFAGFDPNVVAKMGDKEITEIASNKAIALAESRVRCIVDNAKCVVKAKFPNLIKRFMSILIAREVGSFSSYMWGHVNYKPVINRFKYPRNVPLRSAKAEVISKDLLKHGFRFVGPVIVHSFMQAAGLTIDHLVDCFRYGECVSSS